MDEKLLVSDFWLLLELEMDEELLILLTFGGLEPVSV